MSDKELLNSKTEMIENKFFDFSPLSIFFFILKILLAVVLWRFIMTIINLIKLRSSK
ncbi:MAG: hypothetical protein WBA54_04295 [Acidaminobacteraceae bacterium]